MPANAEPDIKTDTESAAASQDRMAIARQAIVDHSSAVFGYELFDRSLAATPHSAASDAQLMFNVLSHADNGALMDSRTMFVNCTHDSLTGGHLELVKPDRIVLEIPPLAGNPADDIGTRLQALLETKKRGFRLAFNQTVLTAAYAQWLPLASFIKIDLSLTKPELVAPLVQMARKRSDAQLIGEKVETAQQYQLLADLDVQLFQGFWFAKPVFVKGQTIRPAQAVIIQLINLVRRQAPRPRSRRCSNAIPACRSTCCASSTPRVLV